MQEEDRTVQPKTFMDLIIKVGSHGTYQKIVTFLFCLNFFTVALLIFNTSFLFYKPGMKCQELGFHDLNCEENLCNIDPVNIAKYQM